jgi:hypothetical protein
VTSDAVLDYVHTVGTSEEALKLPEQAGTLGYCFLHNLDATNYVQVRTATSGTAFIKMLAGEFCLFRFGSGVTAPYIIANSAACKVRVVILEA